jgi:hypothetical protein
MCAAFDSAQRVRLTRCERCSRALVQKDLKAVSVAFLKRRLKRDPNFHASQVVVYRLLLGRSDHRYLGVARRRRRSAQFRGSDQARRLQRRNEHRGCQGDQSPRGSHSSGHSVRRGALPSLPFGPLVPRLYFAATHCAPPENATQPLHHMKSIRRWRRERLTEIKRTL